MGFLERRRQAEHASARVQRERARWRIETQRLRSIAARHREGLIVTGGLLGGIIAARLPWRGFARIGALLGNAASLALRSPLGGLLVEGIAKANGDAAQARADNDS